MSEALCFSRHDYQRLRAVVEHAIEYADLSLKGHLGRLIQQLRTGRVVAPELVPDDLVTLNSRVRVRDLNTGEERVWLLTLPAQANVAEQRLSVLSPAGSALLGARAGETVRWQLGDRSGRLQILEVLFQPEAAGCYDL